MKTHYITLSALFIFLLFGLLFVNGLHFTMEKAIPHDASIVKTAPMNDAETAVLYEHNKNGTFGVTDMRVKFRFLYQYGGGSNGHSVEEGMPFGSGGFANKQQNFILAVKTADVSPIRYVAVGNHIEPLNPTEPYVLTFDDVKSNPDVYQWQEVEDRYALFVWDIYTIDNAVIRAFDHDGNLVADQLYSSTSRYLNEQEGEV
ncbi:hypothetical protein [Paenibacillus sp. NPDC058071]|uniref:hypothetical protein n=1 Tax=Paenibacillus sp. NPDC058071 TaxID=3346326 RepID=UPI0036DDC1E7